MAQSSPPQLPGKKDSGNIPFFPPLSRFRSSRRAPLLIAFSWLLLFVFALGSVATLRYISLSAHARVARVQAIETGIYNLPAAFVPGQPASLRLYVRDRQAQAPAANVPVHLAIRTAAGNLIALPGATGTTAADGTFVANFIVPTITGKSSLVVTTSGNAPDDTVDLPVVIGQDARILISTDKPLYQPGQTMHVRILAAGQGDHHPLPSLPVVLSISDGRGNKVVNETLTTSAHGVSSFDFTIGNTVNEGVYKLQAAIPLTATLTPQAPTATATVDVRPYVLPKFKVSLDSDRKYYAPGAKVSGHLNAAYFFGKPLAGATVSIEGYSSAIAVGSTAPLPQVKLNGTTGPDGSFAFTFDMPNIVNMPTPDDATTASFVLGATVLDTAHQSEQGGLTIPISRRPILLKAVAEAGYLKPGVANTVFIMASYPDGSPAEVAVNITTVDGKTQSLTTSSYGLLTWHYTPPSTQQYNGQIPLQYHAYDHDGHTADGQLLLTSNGYGNGALLITPAQAVVAAGDKLHIDAQTWFNQSSTLQGPVYVDLIAGGQVVATTEAILKDGHGSLELTIPPGVSGSTVLHAYTEPLQAPPVYYQNGQYLEGNRAYPATYDTWLEDTRLLLVQDPHGLQLTVNSEAQSYHPGDQAGVNITVNGSDGKPVGDAAVGVNIVDESVFALGARDAGFARLYFLLNDDLLAAPAVEGFTPANLTVDDHTRVPAGNAKGEADPAYLLARQNAAGIIAATNATTSGTNVSMIQPRAVQAQDTSLYQRKVALVTAEATASVERVLKFIIWSLVLLLSVIFLLVATTAQKVDQLGRTFSLTLVWLFCLCLLLILGLGWILSLVIAPALFVALTFAWLGARRQTEAGRLLRQRLGIALVLMGGVGILEIMYVITMGDDFTAPYAAGIFPLLGAFFVVLLIWWLMLVTAPLPLTEKELLADAVAPLFRRPSLLRSRNLAMVLSPTLLFLFVLAGLNLPLLTGQVNRSLTPYAVDRYGGMPVATTTAKSPFDLNPVWFAAQPPARFEGQFKELDARREGGDMLQGNMPMAAPTTAAAMGSTADAPHTYDKSSSDGTTVSQSTTAAPRLRQFFPETLYSNPQAITDAAGHIHLTVPVADSITTWRISAFASSNDGRLGAANGGLRVFQDFFVDIAVPHDLTIGDEINVPVAVYNYLGDAQQVTLQLQGEDWFTAQDGLTRTLNIGANDVGVVYFRIHVNQRGEHALTVQATGTKLSDAIKRPVSVSPNGREMNSVLGSASLKAGSQTTTSFNLPAEAIPGTGHLTVKLYPGALSQAVEGLDGLLRMPNGCFEQTSSSTYPDLLVLDYLQRTGHDAPDVKAKANKYVDYGYQRLLTFEVPGGGYSLFGQVPADPVITAYGILEFHDMQRVHLVDQAMLDRTIEWLDRQQSSDGAWKTKYWHEGSNYESEDVLVSTAYIVWALSEAGHAADPATQRGLAYIRQYAAQAKDLYTLGLAANALVTADPHGSTTTAILNTLESSAVTDGDKLYWPSHATTVYGSYGKQGDLETTALATYALLKSENHPSGAQGGLRYLLAGKDSFGTWSTTQATVIILKALMLASGDSKGTNATVSLNLNNKAAGEMNLQGDSVKLQQTTLDAVSGTNTLTLAATGQGTIYYEVVADYYLPWSVTPPVNSSLNKSSVTPTTRITTGSPFSLAITYSRNNIAVDESIDVQATVTIQQHANQMLVALGLPPGFTLDTAELASQIDHTQSTIVPPRPINCVDDCPPQEPVPQVTPPSGKVQNQNQNQGKLSRLEQTGRQVLLYVVDVQPGQVMTFHYRLTAHYPLRVQTAPSAVYDYYNPDQAFVLAPATLEVH